MDKNMKQGMTLFQWVWRSYFKASLLPLLVLESALISGYFFSNQFSNHENINTIRDLAEQALTHFAAREAVGIDHQLNAISNATRYLQGYSATVMSAKNAVVKDDPARFAYSPEGAYYTTQDTGGSAVFYSGIIPVGKPEAEKALRTAALDPALIGIKNAFPLVAQSYINTHDSLNRIYPYVDVLKRYPPRMGIPNYNFYYEADAKHNPKRGVVWTDVYIAPAGQTRIASCIAPVYNQTQPDFLEGVVGIDISIENMVNDVKKLAIPWRGYGMLISRSGTILALPQNAEVDWGISGLTHSDYANAIKQDTFRPKAYNVYLKPAVAEAIKNTATGFKKVTLTTDSLLAWATIPATGWKIIIVTPEQAVLKPANALAERLNQIAVPMLVGLLLFDSLFLLMLHRRAIKMSLSISKPLKKMDTMVADIASGKPILPPFKFIVTELDATAKGIFLMGVEVEVAKQAHAQAAEAWRKKSEQLQAIFDVSPSGYMLVNDHNEIVLSNNAFSHLLGISPTEALTLREPEFLQRISEQAKAPLTLSPSNALERIELIRPRPASLIGGIRLIQLPNNTVMGKVYFFHDITKNEEIDRIKSDFITHVTHELRTPLTRILDYSELLLSSRITPSMQPEIFGQIHQQSTHLVKMINELLDLAKIAKRSGSDFVISPHSLAELLESAVRKFPVPPQRQAIRFSPLESDVTVNVDRLRFTQALWSVIDNAYQFSTGENGVSLRVKYDEAQHRVAIEIADNGIGMDKNERDQAFDRFYRADKSGNAASTGLGLSLAKDIMTLLNGTIAIDSAPYQGTRVTIALPAISQVTSVFNAVN